MKTECNTCGKEFDAPTMTWARNKRTGQEAGGCDGRDENGKLGWHGQDWNDKWPESEVEEFEQQVGGVGTFGKCPDCEERYHRACERAAEYNSPCAPDWFDPGYAGERWDDDY